LAVEGGGAVCVGTLLDSGVTVVWPEDGSYEKYTLPVDLADGAVTNICFGGPDLRTAYITCSVTGRLISCRWPRPGLQLAFQQLPKR
jgi:gluconolactonase